MNRQVPLGSRWDPRATVRSKSERELKEQPEETPCQSAGAHDRDGPESSRPRRRGRGGVFQRKGEDGAVEPGNPAGQGDQGQRIEPIPQTQLDDYPGKRGGSERIRCRESPQPDRQQYSHGDSEECGYGSDPILWEGGCRAMKAPSRVEGDGLLNESEENHRKKVGRRPERLSKEPRDQQTQRNPYAELDHYSERAMIPAGPETGEDREADEAVDERDPSWKGGPFRTDKSSFEPTAPVRLCVALRV